MSKIKLPHSSGNSMSIAAPATNPASDLELKLPATIGTANQVLKNSGTAGTLEFGYGIEVDQWRLHTNLTGVTSGVTITSNLERSDTDFSKIGTGMSESSGVFTFPSTGIWKVNFQTYMTTTVANNNWAGCYIQASTDGSSYVTRAECWTSMDGADGSTANYGSTNSEFIFDVTNTSTHKVKFFVASNTNTAFHGATAGNLTFMTFLRLGDT